MRQYQINGKVVGREVWHDFLLTGDWEVANIYKVNRPKEFQPPEVENVISPERAKQLRDMSRQAKENT